MREPPAQFPPPCRGGALGAATHDDPLQVAAVLVGSVVLRWGVGRVVFLVFWAGKEGKALYTHHLAPRKRITPLIPSPQTKQSGARGKRTTHPQHVQHVLQHCEGGRDQWMQARAGRALAVGPGRAAPGGRLGRSTLRGAPRRGAAGGRRASWGRAGGGAAPASNAAPPPHLRPSAKNPRRGAARRRLPYPSNPTPPRGAAVAAATHLRICC